MVIIAELTLRGDGLLFVETFERLPAASARFEDAHYVRTDDGSIYYVFFWAVSNADREAFERAVAADDTVSTFRHVTALESAELYRIETPPFHADRDLLFPLFREHDVTAIEAHRDGDGFHVQARYPGREALEHVLEAGKHIAEHFELIRLYEEVPTSSSPDRLTDRQRAALAIALEKGYFETPAEASLEDVAAAMDITPQTASRHVRVGVRKLVAHAVGTDHRI